MELMCLAAVKLSMVAKCEGVERSRIAMLGKGIVLTCEEAQGRRDPRRSDGIDML